MRNYIILNGKNSINIQGLLIQKLPPISKPKIRTQIEEIDGRDGDIITPLGYSAYDKKFPIGLYGDFDIDEIIAFFNTSGIVVFSNEPDKFYHYEIVSQIDFERLIRFRTAEVTMHIQPFKYSATDNDKVFNITNENSIQIRNSGNIYSKPTLTITGSGNIGIYLNEIQLFQIQLGNVGSITIDTEKMEAYKEGNLLNRLVSGNYDNFKLNIGKNNISWTGNVSKIEIQNYSRWI